MSRPTSPTGPTWPDGDGGWERLDRRMLLVHPVRELGRFLPVLVGLLVAGSVSGLGGLQLAGVAAPIAYGVLRWVTTTYRIGDGRVELRRGLVGRRVASVALDRVRTVDLTTPLVHRLVGVTVLRIGTGAGGDDALDLDGLDARVARDLRGRLLPAGGPAATQGPEADDGAPADGTVAAFEARWLAYAPLTASGLAVVAAVAAVTSQVVNARDVVSGLDPSGWAAPVPPAAALTLAVVGLLVAAALVSVVGYAVANGRFRLARGATSWQVSRGLLTTRETTLDVDRVAGVVVGEPLVLRLAGGSHLTAIVTGVDREQRGSAVLVPPAPTAVVGHAAGAVLGDAAPIRDPLVAHGTRAVRRRWVRALVPATAAALLLVAATLLGAPGWLAALAPLPVAAGVVLALDRARSLGHALLPGSPGPTARPGQLLGRPGHLLDRSGHLVARSGSLLRRREVLDLDHVIGWTLRATWWQRRAGLTTLVATTAGGSGLVRVLDVPEAVALALVRNATPAMVAPFLAERSVPPPSSSSDAPRDDLRNATGDVRAAR